MTSARTRIGAGLTAGLALSAAALMSVTGGTVAALSDSVNASATVGVEGVPYGIARGVSAAFHYDASVVGGGQNTDNRSTVIDSRTVPSRTDTATFPVPWSYSSPGIRLDAARNVTACASSTTGGNTNRCPGTTGGAPLVSASSGNDPSVGKFDIDFVDTRVPNTNLQLHDVWTSVSCRADGTVSAETPRGNFNLGGTGSWASGHDKRLGWRSIPAENRFVRIQQWASRYSQMAQTVEVQTIKQTFANPPRALSAIVLYVTGSDSKDGTAVRSDFSFVTKSECAVSPDGSVTLNPSTTFGPLVPSVRRLETPAWNGDYSSTLAEGGVTTFGHVSQRQSMLEARTPSDASVVEPFHSGVLEATDPSSTPVTSDTESAIPEASPLSPSSPTSEVSPARSAKSTTEATAPTATASTTANSAGPDPAAGKTATRTSATSAVAPAAYTTADGQTYSRAGGDALTAAQRALVEEAIAAAATTESGELPGGASYAVTANQLDGTTLIVTTADGGTLRIVWEA
ncbi:hypothetical protein [Dietzia sp. 179-F 9C3 NHS]|uniref:hypothetical protein n=1 Tax=Dietzia sp. 179-F 9C3 NHS TaxID=3374295 RepID=UPI003879A8F7